MAVATVTVHKGGRLKLHIENINFSTNNTFLIPANFRIEYLYAIITTTIVDASTLHGIDLSVSTPLDTEAGTYYITSILKASPHYISGVVGSFFDLTTRVNRKLFSYDIETIADKEVTITGKLITRSSGAITDVTTGDAPYKLIIGLESII